ncbi:pyridoxamine 5'-phosphate oxidase family protein [Lentzea sp. NBRC 105346]|uniref:pyridoxamine 5'-phosphate oxidase family protein n=1 Tax=Lentzea sp. NBRC 105346 TaxID=3032205 RepID=UPI002557668C|nr:pyridoxamine 5'-phosphate oxidase family protein [Lentzea sp. NBRC 105346]
MPDQIELLTPHQCLQLLPTVRVGRMRPHQVVVRVDGKANLGAISGGTVIAFEADDLDPDLPAGWAVTVVGHAHLIDETDNLIELAHGRCVGIAMERVTGLRLSRAVLFCARTCTRPHRTVSHLDERDAAFA